MPLSFIVNTSRMFFAMKDIKTKFNNQLNKSALYIFISLSLVLVVFYFSLINLLDDVYLLKPNLSSQILLLYFLFSLTVLLFFLIFAVGVNRMIYAPLTLVLKRIQNLKNSTESDQRDYFEELPDFWNEVESEVTGVVEFLKKKGKQSDRIKKTIENILNVFPEPTLVVSRDGTIKYSNKSFSRVFQTQPTGGITHLSDILREPQVLALIEVSDSTSMRKEIETQIKDQKKIFMVFKTPYATRNEDGDYDFLVIFHDITQAKKTDQMKTDFVSNVSHELRTPLMSIQGYMQTLKEDVQSNRTEEIPKYIEIIDSHVERLSNLVGDLLELSYLESDIVLNKHPLNPKDTTQKVLQQFSADLEKGHYHVEQKYLAQEIYGHERLVEQVLINLVQNSLRYTPPGTKIDIEWNQRQGQTELVFRDNGPGISQEHLGRIFERFYRIDPHRSRSRGGTGLGLSIVKHIIQRHGGGIHVQSQLGRGVEFICKFPSN